MEASGDSFDYDYLIDYDPDPKLQSKLESEIESSLNAQVDSLSVQFADSSDSDVSMTSSDDSKVLTTSSDAEIDLNILTSLNGENLDEMDVIDLELISDLVKKLLEQQEALEDDYVASEV